MAMRINRGGRGAAAAILAGAALALGGGGAQAATVFDVFRELCVKSDADPAAALAQAEALGWGKAPARIIRVLTAASEPGEVTSGADGRGVPDGTLSVVVGRTNWMIPRTEVAAQACILSAGPGVDAEAVAREAEAFAGVPGRTGVVFQKQAVVYLWRDEGGQRTPVAPEDLVSARTQGGLKMLVVMSLRGVSVLELFVPVEEQS